MIDLGEEIEPKRLLNPMEYSKLGTIIIQSFVYSTMQEVEIINLSIKQTLYVEVKTNEPR